MKSLSKTIGERIRNYRNREGLSQEQLAERCDLHPTYIGQLERGEKNATLESMERIVKGLNISFETLFEKIQVGDFKNNVASQCYSLVDALNEKEQAAIYELIQKIIAYKNIWIIAVFIDAAHNTW